MGLWLIVVAINLKKGWLRTICFWIAFIWSTIAVLRSREMILYTLFIQVLAWIVMFALGYGIRFGIRRWKRWSDDSKQE